MQEMQETQVRSPDWEDPLEEDLLEFPRLVSGKSQRQRNLAGYNPWGCKKSVHDWPQMHAPTCGILVPWPGSKPASPTLEGRFLTPGLPGKSSCIFSIRFPPVPSGMLPTENLGSQKCQSSQEQRSGTQDIFVWEKTGSPSGFNESKEWRHLEVRAQEML